MGFFLKNCKFRPIPNLVFHIQWNGIITTDNAIKTKQNGCKRLAEQTIFSTEKRRRWQHGPGIDASLYEILVEYFFQIIIIK